MLNPEIMTHQHRTNNGLHPTADTLPVINLGGARGPMSPL